MKDTKEYQQGYVDGIESARDVSIKMYLEGLYKIQNLINEWNIARNNLEFNLDSEIAMLQEEVNELGNAEGKDDHEFIDALADICVVAMGGIFKFGYDYSKVMEETIREISSRQQDPVQKLQWEENGANGKWRKNPVQLASTLYKANYSNCKL